MKGLDVLQILQGWTNKTLSDYNALPKEMQELSDNRMSHCNKCEENAGLQGVTAKCLKCGCYLPQKTLGLSQKCPLNKW